MSKPQSKDCNTRLIKKYEVTVISGSGKDYGVGLFKVSETNKYYIIEPVFARVFPAGFFHWPSRTTIRKDNKGPHNIRMYGDDIVVFPQRQGVPYIFVPVNKNHI